MAYTPVLHSSLVTTTIINTLFLCGPFEHKLSSLFTVVRAQTGSSRNRHKQLYLNLEQICTLSKRLSALLMYNLRASLASRHCPGEEHMVPTAGRLFSFSESFPLRQTLHNSPWVLVFSPAYNAMMCVCVEGAGGGLLCYTTVGG